MPSGNKSAAIAAGKPKVIGAVPEGFKKCTSTGCPHHIPINDRYKKCAVCRETNRITQARARAKKASATQESNAESDGEGGEHVDHPQKTSEERPKKKQKVAGRDADSDTSDEESETSYTLRSVMKTTEDIHFKGQFMLPVEDGMDEKTRVQLMNREITAATSLRWTLGIIRDIGVPKTRRRREWINFNAGAACASRVIARGCKHGKHSLSQSTSDIDCGTWSTATIPCPMAPVQEFVAISRPSDITDRVSNAQIYNAWWTVVECFWKRDDNQMISTERLLKEYKDEVDVFAPQGVPEDIEILCWGMKQITQRLKTRVVEIAMDATYNTNAKQLELYGIMAEFDNAGFPLAYCLLSTTSSISHRKHVKTLTTFTTCVRDTYNIHPEFTHVDKDLGEISVLADVWNPKISICWWHIDDAVTKHLKKAKLSTTPYKVKRAQAQFSFIASDFLSQVKHDKDEYKGGKPDDEVSDDEGNTATQNPSRLPFRLPPLPSPQLDANGVPVLRIPRPEDIYFRDELDSEDDNASADSEVEDDNASADSEVEEPMAMSTAGQKRNMGIPLGELVSPQPLGALGMLGTSHNSALANDDDLREAMPRNEHESTPRDPMVPEHEDSNDEDLHEENWVRQVTTYKHEMRRKIAKLQ
ncbi:hypothetical protein GGX14DRAFT_679021 [Mycena pura]|uniref:MULE transposase domain-containing protein n=1 Tax=Mycena pura TaxID=153505 RepID=A0AAD6Y509_9AGAR|nr:hypothetical protein GGX14DRAFT_679021 [Mycena pura]